ncbi:MAG: serine hydrolase [Thermoanaerobaculia bacterium]
MRRTSIPLFCLALLLTLVDPASGATATETAPDALGRFADETLSAAYPADGPGAAALVRWRGKTILRRGYGMANLDLGVPITPDSVFEVGSVTKQFTAASILRLSEQGKLELADPVTRFLPDFPTGGRVVTLQQLLTHTSGVPSYTSMPEWLPRWREDMSVETLIGIFAGKPFDFEPGTSWSYSNSGYILLGAVIEKVSGRSYEEYVEEELFAPLGMANTRFGHQEEIVRGRVSGYHRGLNGLENAPYLSLTQPYAAGSLMSTVDDLALWSDALEAGRVVSPASRDRMFTPAIVRGGEQDGVSTRYGLGYGILEVAGRTVHEHGGGIPGFAADLLRVPDEDMVVVILSNQPESAPSRLARQIVERAFASAAGAVPPVVLPADELDRYVGVYRVAGSPDARQTVTRDGTTLRLQRTGGSLRELRPLGDDRFGFAEETDRLRFRRDAAGGVVSLEFDHGFGPVFRSPRTDEPLPHERAAIAVDPAIYDDYVGVYALAPGFDIAVSREGDGLFARATGQERLEIFPEAIDRFFFRAIDAEIEFVREPGSGRTGSLVLHQGGQDLPAPRKP